MSDMTYNALDCSVADIRDQLFRTDIERSTKMAGPLLSLPLPPSHKIPQKYPKTKFCKIPGAQQKKL